MSGGRTRIELELEREGDRILLLAPDVGAFTSAMPCGAALAPGMIAGALHRLGGAVDLVVPPGAAGAVTNDPPDRVLAPVGYRDVLYRLDPGGAVAALADEAPGAAGITSDDLVVAASQSGRIWRSPSPGEPPFCDAGDVLEDGSPLCLVEVMKTFSTVPYRAAGGLPGRARVVRWIVADGADVQQGEAVLAVEPA